MAKYTYTGTLTDIGVSALAGYTPRLTVRPQAEAFGPSGIVSAKRVLVPVNPSGSFSMQLQPSTELTPTRGGPTGVKYVLEVALFEDTFDGSQRVIHRDSWSFSAVAGGGDIGDMADLVPYGPIVAVLAPPPEDTEGVAWFDLTDVNSQGVMLYAPPGAA